jgi:hypothetical protein
MELDNRMQNAMFIEVGTGATRYGSRLENALPRLKWLDELAWYNWYMVRRSLCETDLE